jgi:23S rRNA pseudouridine1911/1915/1917 synthase
VQPLPQPQTLRAIIARDACGERLDVTIAKLISSLSRREAQRLCTLGRVRVNGKIAKKSDLTREGDVITIELDHTAEATPCPGPLTLRLVTEHWVIVVKPPLQPTAPKSSEETNALANALVSAFPEMAKIGYRALEPGLVHRLDNGTSGLIVAARTKAAFEGATRALKQSRWQKTYFALVQRKHLPERGAIIGALEPWPEHPHRVRLVSSISLVSGDSHLSTSGSAETWVTRFEIEKQCGDIALLNVFVGPAYRHQIRAHFSAIDAPLLNDEVYGAKRDLRLAKGRHALHAARVAWEGEGDLEGFDVEEPLALDLTTRLNSVDTLGEGG